MAEPTRAEPGMENGGTELTREVLHHRRIDFRGFKRSDGLLEVEARLTDCKTHNFLPPSGGQRVAAGDTCPTWRK